MAYNNISGLRDAVLASHLASTANLMAMSPFVRTKVLEVGEEALRKFSNYDTETTRKSQC